MARQQATRFAVDPEPLGKGVQAVEGYDAFAIGWNEIFDPPESGSPWPGRASQPHVRGQGVEVSRVPLSARSARAGSTPSETSRGSRRAPASWCPTPGAAAAGDARRPDAYWSADILTSTRPPPYLRIKDTSKTKIDREIRASLTVYKPEQLRKPSEAWEGEFKSLRKKLEEAHETRRKEARRMRRLRRRCNVSENEDLEELREQYTSAGYLAPLPDPVKQPYSPHLHTDTQEFFGSIRRRNVQVGTLRKIHVSPGSAFRIGGPHTAR